MSGIQKTGDMNERESKTHEIAILKFHKFLHALILVYRIEVSNNTFAIQSSLLVRSVK